MRKIVSRDELVGIRQQNEGKKIILCHGVFDLLHYGHIIHMQEAKLLGDILVVTITGDGYCTKRDKLFFNEKQRAKQLAALEVVDYVAVIHDSTGLPGIEALRPDIYVKGQEYKEHQGRNTRDEKKLLDSYGATFHFTDTKEFSSTKIGYLSGRMSGALESEPLAEEGPKFVDLAPTNYTMSDMRKFILEASKLDVLVIGETIIDEWVFDRMQGYSRETKAMTGLHMSKKQQVGGAGIVARHIKEFARTVDHVGMTNPGTSGPPYGVVKTRYVNSDTQKAIYVHESVFSTELDELPDFSKYNLIVVADFGHGLISHDMAKKISHANTPFLAVQAQTNTFNYGMNLPSKYPKADYYNMNCSEARLLVGNPTSKLELHQSVLNKLRTRFVSITYGDQGAVMAEDFGRKVELPALCTGAVNIVGCGDSLFALSSLALRLGFKIDTALFIGSLAAAIMATKLGNEGPVTSKELKQVWKVCA